MTIFMMDSSTNPAISRQLSFGRSVYCLILDLIYEAESLIAAGVQRLDYGEYITFNNLSSNLAMTIKI